MKFNYDYNSRFRILKGGKISLVVSALVAGTTLSYAAPSGGVVSSGSANIAQNGSVTTITQSTSKASINWNSFSIGQSETVNFKQPDVSSITLNRVVGNERSVIDGALNANGQVWLLNSNGVLFNKNASINTAGLLATTQSLSDTDFQNAHYTFSGDSTASVINLGTMSISDGGYATLLAHTVQNEGTIQAIKGTVELVGANEATINLNGNSMVSLQVNKGVLDALVENKGAIIADGGHIYLTTNAVDELLRGVVNNTGLLEANSLGDITGEIVLFAHGGEVKVAGALKAQEGFIETSGKEFSIAEGTTIKAGEWLIDPTNITISSNTCTGTNCLTATQISTALSGGTDVTIATDGEGVANGDITINASVHISKTAGDEATLTLKAHNNIVVQENISISSSVDKLNVVLWSDADGSGEGRIQIGNMAMLNTITTNGGHLWMGGGGGSTLWNGLSVGNGAATSSSAHGIDIVQTAITTAGGDVFIKGTHTGTNDDVRGVNAVGFSINSGSGDVTIIGETGGSGGDNGGIFLGTSITSTTGDITLTGIIPSGSSGDGIYVANPISTSGDIALYADKLAFSPAGTLASSGTLTIAPYTVGTTIGIGGGTGTLALPSGYFSNNFIDGFSGITIGSADAGAITLGAVVFRDAMTLHSASGATQSGAITGGQDLTLLGTGATYTLTNASNDIASLSATTGSVAYVDSNALSVKAITAQDTIDIATRTGDLTLTDNIATASTAANAITLNAGQSQSAGTATGGNIIHTSGTITTGSGGRAMLYSGDYSESTGLVTLIGSGSGNFRYNADETTATYAPELGTGVYAIYREAQGVGMEEMKIPYILSVLNETYNGTDYSLSSLWSATSIFGASFSTWVLGTDYLFMYDGGSVTSFKNASTYSNITVDVLKSGYNEASSGNSAGALTIDKAHLTVTADNKSKNYSDANPLLTSTITGFVGGEDLSTSGVSGSATPTTTATSATAGGSYVITATTGTLSAANYDFTTLVNGTLTISGPTQAELDAQTAQQAADALAAQAEAARIAAEQEAARLAAIEVARIAAEQEAARLAAIEVARIATEQEAARLAAIEAARIATEQEAARLAALEVQRLAQQAQHIVQQAEGAKHGVRDTVRALTTNPRGNTLPSLNFIDGSIHLPDGLEEDLLTAQQ